MDRFVTRLKQDPMSRPASTDAEKQLTNLDAKIVGFLRDRASLRHRRKCLDGVEDRFVLLVGLDAGAVLAPPQVGVLDIGFSSLCDIDPERWGHRSSSIPCFFRNAASNSSNGRVLPASTS